jgi:hypothetical protein
LSSLQGVLYFIFHIEPLSSLASAGRQEKTAISAGD